ncbi:MAG TPA: glycosyltransferase, partial [Saprospiraceae bacterium]|nr:glycosyltransferase [Saprospiraceae bacterium]
MSRENIDRSWVDNVHSELELTNLPLITLGVLSYNRKEDLRGTLDVLTAGIWYPRIEIIVIDNGSKDDSMEMVRSLFPEVQIVELSENVGIAARNNLFKRANGKYI